MLLRAEQRYATSNIRSDLSFLCTLKYDCVQRFYNCLCNNAVWRYRRMQGLIDYYVKLIYRFQSSVNLDATAAYRNWLENNHYFHSTLKLRVHWLVINFGVIFLYASWYKIDFFFKFYLNGRLVFEISGTLLKIIRGWCSWKKQSIFFKSFISHKT